MTVHEQVKDYYGNVLGGTDDLKTSACCTADEMPGWLKPIVSSLHDEVLARYYGCGLVAPEQLPGLSVLDLGSGSGRDCYVLSALVGEKGHVTGVDMTAEQLAVARRHEDYHARTFGHGRSNVQFLEGNIDALEQLALDDGSFDVVISNCVINLCQDKAGVLRNVWRLLRDGGEMYFSDVYADRRIPADLRDDPVLYGECLSGALYWNDFLRLARAAGFADPRLVSSRPLTVDNEALADRIGHIGFWSATYRLFKLPALESACEDYGQAVVYRGTIEHCPRAFALDGHHYMETGKVFPVCGNTWMMLHDTRFREHFEFIGDFDTHYGIFEGCGTPVPFADTAAPDGSGSCC
ncbi:MAG: methyltransferase domain-containing protein [Alcanivoracaceae bacterium]|nr:methyltransferase domain-containing protein [Alcanivoracaceae bacterium]